MKDIRIETITPEIAQEYLGANTANRNISRNRVFQYAEDMENGRWHFSGDPIKFSASGEMIDGQHRLMAVIDSKTTQEFVVIRNLGEKSKYVTDTGMPRSAANLLQFGGHKNTNRLASAIRMCVMSEKGQLASVGSRVVGPQEVLEFLENNPDIVDAVSFISTSSLRPIVPCSCLCFCYFMTQRIDKQKSDEFWSLLDTTPRDKQHPCTALKECVTNMKIRSKRGGSLPKATILAYMVKAWNAFYNDNKVVILRYAKGEAFPKFAGADKK